MKSFRLLLLFVVGCCFFPCEPAWAQVASSAYTFPKQFSADEIATTKDGATITMKTFMDSGKIRTEINSNGMQMVSILRPDQQKMYSVMTAQKMVMVMPLDAAKLKQMLPPGSGGDAKMETVGPDTVDGLAAIKYKITSDSGKVVFLWVGVASQFPVQAAADDGSFTLVYKNFQTGPQDAALFEPPSGYQVMNMPSSPGAPPPAGGQ
jgi:hypothetical protein